MWTRTSSLLRAVAVASLVLAAGCAGESSTTSPSTTTPTVAPATVNETFAGLVPVGGAAFYSFSVVERGTVNLTLSSVGGTGVPSTAWMGLGIGTPSGIDCVTSATTNTAAGSAVHVTATQDPGVYCARVFDIGNLVSPALVTVAIAHP